MIDSVAVEFFVNPEAMSQIEDVGLSFDVQPITGLVSVRQDIDETLIESMSNDELIEFIGIDSEFLVYTNIQS